MTMDADGQFLAPKKWRELTRPDWSTYRWPDSLWIGCDAIIVDESSMVDRQYHDAFLNCGRPVIWSGDNKQLPPVTKDDDQDGKEVWSVFNQEYQQLELFVNERAKESPAQAELCKHVRDGGTFDQKKHRIHPDDVDSKKFPVMCYRNARANHYNELLRAQTGDVAEGDLIVFKSGCHSNIIPSMRYEVVSSKIVEVTTKGWRSNDTWEVRCLEVKLAEEFGDKEDEDVRDLFETRMVFSVIESERKNLHGKTQAEIKYKLAEIKTLMTSLSKLAKEDWQDRAELELEIDDLWNDKDTINHWYREHYNEWTYGYGITVHKAQGSTFQKAIFDYEDIAAARWRSTDYFNRLLYTAISRGKEGAFAISVGADRQAMNIVSLTAKIDRIVRMLWNGEYVGIVLPTKKDPKFRMCGVQLYAIVPLLMWRGIPSRIDGKLLVISPRSEKPEYMKIWKKDLWDICVRSIDGDLPMTFISWTEWVELFSSCSKNLVPMIG